MYCIFYIARYNQQATSDLLNNLFLLTSNGLTTLFTLLKGCRNVIQRSLFCDMHTVDLTHITYDLQEYLWEEKKRWIVIPSLLFLCMHYWFDWKGHAAESLFHSSQLWIRVMPHPPQLISLAEEEKALLKCTTHPWFSRCNVIDDFMDKWNNKNGTNALNHYVIWQWNACYKKRFMMRSTLLWSKYACYHSLL